jgi:pimeloyl-ACP methyl ester carboxylesterase
MTQNMHRRRKIMPYLFVALALAAVAGVAAWRMFGTPPKPVTVPPGAKAGDLILRPCTVKIGGITYAADCGTLVVPEYRGDPAARLIALPVRRIHSPAAAPAEPVFYLTGGPGQSNLAMTPPAWLLESRDFVNVGYRGVDGTPRLDCPGIVAAMHGFGGDLLAPASLDRIGAAAASCAADLRARGIDLRGYTIPETVEDLETARTGFGYARVDLLSESYGTRVAQEYAYRHPESLLRSAMIGVNPPGHFLWLPETVDAQIGQYADLCRRDPACAVRTSDLAESIRRVNRSMPSRWGLLPIDPGKVRVTAFAMLFHRSTAPMVIDAYLAADRGDPSGLALMSAAYDFMMPDMMVWGEFMAIGVSADYRPGVDYRAALDAPDSILGSPMAELVWGSAAGYWPVPEVPNDYRSAQPTDVETLLISGSVDFSTPAEFGTKELLPFLKNGRQVILAEQGHVQDFWSFQPGAARRLLTSFYDTGTGDDSLYEYLPMDFRPALSFPLLAKILLGTGALLLLAAGIAARGFVLRLRGQGTAKGAAAPKP